MSLSTATSAALAILRAKQIPDASALAREHGTTLWGAEAAIRQAEDEHYGSAMPTPGPKTTNSRGTMLEQKRKAEEKADQQARQLPRMRSQK